MARRELKNRLAAIVAAVFPANSVAARVEQLTPQDRAIVAAWQAACRDYHVRFPGELAYARQLDGYAGPELPHTISAALFDAVPHLPEGATHVQAAAAWQEATR